MKKGSSLTVTYQSFVSSWKTEFDICFILYERDACRYIADATDHKSDLIPLEAEDLLHTLHAANQQ